MHAAADKPGSCVCTVVSQPLGLPQIVLRLPKGTCSALLDVDVERLQAGKTSMRV